MQVINRLNTTDETETATLYEPEIVEAYDEKGNIHYICSICETDVNIQHESDGPDDYTVEAYCEKHGQIS